MIHTVSVVGDAVEADDDIIGGDGRMSVRHSADVSALNHQTTMSPSVAASTDVDKHLLLGSQHVPSVARLI